MSISQKEIWLCDDRLKQSMTTVKAEIVLATCTDERYPPSNMLDGKHETYYVTTGVYPQEFLVAFKAGTVNVSRITLVMNSVKKLRIEKSTEQVPSKFEGIVDCEVSSREGGRQIEQFQVNKATVGNRVTFLKVVVESGHDDFAAFYELSVEGEELGSN